MPCHAERYCFTIWVDAPADKVNTPQETQLRLSPSALDDPDALIEALRLSPLQRSLSRAVYDEEYEESISQCMAGAPGCQEMVQAHRMSVDASRQSAGLRKLIDLLRQHKPHR
ncbi:unnamed protein product [Vitrella brassicaformis CCMP3155]|uniref:Uncharacterized protein n=1 Tax=Vitrella brassicaformis (strain CCMP3155) TaxID=1169540 RepID=A0A0G4GV05_VITBC|nr:unnamed protein product [Vitrella brassicaformis CCMP3155]|mmetsp:Transcript_15521/g.36983  ORF Transcript_15521/g.36983 Transcript_15521/m.36983 type:complete len:113 (-) Transcript_15521:3253-3591(-)|eukprot:CEM34729.1 unnamed protein product [Vitrella brassicaformis CCMP3155]